MAAVGEQCKSTIGILNQSVGAFFLLNFEYFIYCCAIFKWMGFQINQRVGNVYKPFMLELLVSSYVALMGKYEIFWANGLNNNHKIILNSLSQRVSLKSQLKFA